MRYCCSIIETDVSKQAHISKETLPIYAAPAASSDEIHDAP